MAFSLGRNPIGLRLTVAGLMAVAVVVLLVIFGIYALSGWITVPQGHFVVLMRKTGTGLTNEQLLATGPDFLTPDPEAKGVQVDVLKEGYHMLNPYTWWWSDPIPALVVPEMSVAVVTRKYGEPLPPGQVLAETDTQKGVLRKVLMPGRYYANTFAYSAQIIPMVRIEPGFMGVVTRLVGDPPADPNLFVVKDGERGTQPKLLPPGVHPEYSNKYVYKVVPIDVRSQKLELQGATALDFLSEDGFPIHTEGTIEYALDQQKLPEMFVMFVDEKDLEKSGGLKNIEEKLIVPLGRSLYRIYGAQHKAVDYLTGSTRIVVQNQIETELKTEAAKDGIIIRSFVIRSIEPPVQVRQQYERRELAKRQKEQYLAEIIKEIGYPAVEGGKQKIGPDGQPVFDHGVPVIEGGTRRVDDKGQPVFEGGRLSKELQSQMKDRAEKIGTVRLEIADVTRAAEQYGKVELTKANQRLSVAQLGLEAADDLAASKTAAGEAQAAVIRLKNQAEVAGVQASVQALGGGDHYAQYLLATRFAPAITNIWSNTEGPFAELFKTLTAPAARSAQQGVPQQEVAK